MTDNIPEYTEAELAALNEFAEAMADLAALGPDQHEEKVQLLVTRVGLSEEKAREIVANLK